MITVIASVLVAALIAAGVALFEVDRTFKLVGIGRAYRSPAWWGFVLGNAALAASAYFALRGLEPFSGWNPYLSAVLIGMAYLALIRLKFATVSFKDQEVPVGVDVVYESWRQFVYSRINAMVKAERTQKVRDLIARCTLRELVAAVRLDIGTDSLLSPEERKTLLAWLLQLLQDNSTDEDEKKQFLASYLVWGAHT